MPSIVPTKEVPITTHNGLDGVVAWKEKTISPKGMAPPITQPHPTGNEGPQLAKCLTLPLSTPQDQWISQAWNVGDMLDSLGLMSQVYYLGLPKSQEARWCTRV